MRKHSNCPATRVVMMPSDTNGMGNIFGGVILSHIDLAGAVEARTVCSNRIVTVCMKEVVFKKPVHVNDILTCWAEVTKIGTTSVTTVVHVEVERNGKFIPVTEATVIYVAVDGRGKPTPVKLLPGASRNKPAGYCRTRCAKPRCGASPCGKKTAGKASSTRRSKKS